MSVIVDQSLESDGAARFCVVCSRVYRDGIRTCPEDGTPLSIEAADDGAAQVGRVLGQYKLVRLLGEGGASAVYEAEHVRLGRRVALKLLHRDLVDAENATRFFNEARAVNQIRHPNIIDIEDFVSTPTGERYMIMELLQGEDLRALLDRERQLSSERVAELGAQIASAVAAVHRAGIIHRDLKPDNIFVVDKDGIPTVKLLDFGIAKILEEKQGVTRAGMTVGTPKYMAPEQIVSDGVADVRSDIYALGMLMYEALAGKAAFTGDIAAILRAHLAEAVTPPSKHRTEPVSDVLEAAVLKCLEKDPANRFANADDLRVALHAERPVRRLHTPPPFAVPRVSGLFPRISAQISAQFPSISGEFPSASGEFEPPSGRWRVFVEAPIVVAALAVLALRLSPVVNAEDAAGTTSAAAQVSIPTDARPSPTRPVAAPPTPAPATITLELTSTPEGAEIFFGDERTRLGVAPVTVTIPASHTLVPLIAKFPGGGEVVEQIIPNRPLRLALVKREAPPTKPQPKRPVDNVVEKKPVEKKPVEKKPATGRDETVDPFTFK